MIYVIILIYNLIIWLKTKDYKPAIDDATLYKTKVSKVWWKRLYGSHTVDNVQIDRGITIGLHTVMSLLVGYATDPLVGLAYTVHPTTQQVGVWLNGKRYAICGIIAMLILISPLFAVFYPIIFLFQPIGIPAALLFLFDINAWIALIVAAGCFYCGNKYLIRRFKSRSKDTFGTILQQWDWRKLIFAVKSYWVYFRQCTLPERNLMYYSDYNKINYYPNKMYDLKDVRFYAGILSIVFTIVFWNEGMWLFALFILMWCNFKTYLQTFADRYAYIALVGIMWTLNSIIPEAMPYLIGFYVARSWFNAEQYKGFVDQLWFNHFHDPMQCESLQNLALTWLKDGRFDHNAFCLLRDNIERHGDVCSINYCYGVALCRIGDRQGIGFLKKALELVDHHTKKLEMDKTIRQSIKDFEQKFNKEK